MKFKLFVFLMGFFVFGASSLGAASFKDIPAGHWAQKAVDELKEMGIIQGFSNGYFGGDEKLSRYEMAVWLKRLELVTLKRMAIREKLIREFAAETAEIGLEIKRLKRLTK